MEIADNKQMEVFNSPERDTTSPSEDYSALVTQIDTFLQISTNVELRYAVNALFQDFEISPDGNIKDWVESYVEKETKDIAAAKNAVEQMGYSASNLNFSFEPIDEGHRVTLLQDGIDAAPVTYKINDRVLEFTYHGNDSKPPVEVQVLNQFMRQRIAKNGFILSDLIINNGNTISLNRIEALLRQEVLERSVFRQEDVSIGTLTESLCEHIYIQLRDAGRVEKMPLVQNALRRDKVSIPINQALEEMDQRVGRKPLYDAKLISEEVADQIAEKCLTRNYELTFSDECGNLMEAVDKLGRPELFTPIQERVIPKFEEATAKVAKNLKETLVLLNNSDDTNTRSVARFFAASLYPILDKSKDSQLDSTDLEKLVNHLAKYSFDQEVPIAFYYALSKLRSPLRTGSMDGQIDLAEIEMVRRLAEVQNDAKTLGMNIKFILVNETTEASGTLLGVSQDIIDSNNKLVYEYLSHIGASGSVEIRSLQDDIRQVLDTAFDNLHTEAKAEIMNSGFDGLNHRIAILMACIPTEGLLELGLDEQEIRQVQKLFIQSDYDLSKYPQTLVNYAKDLTAHFNGVMNLRKQAKTKAKEIECPPPQYTELAVHIGVTRSGSRLSFEPSKRFRGEMVFPNHGLPIYSDGQYEGNIPLWHVVMNKDLFKVLIVNDRIVGVDLLPLSLKLNLLNKKHES